MLRKSQTIGFILVALVVGSAACSHRGVMTVGTHTVTVSRHGLEKNRHMAINAGTFEYEGISTAGVGLKVTITGDIIKVNGKDYGLRPGDSVLITDDGVAVNALDYGETEEYLRANKASSETGRN